MEAAREHKHSRPSGKPAQPKWIALCSGALRLQSLHCRVRLVRVFCLIPKLYALAAFTRPLHQAPKRGPWYWSLELGRLWSGTPQVLQATDLGAEAPAAAKPSCWLPHCSPSLRGCGSGGGVTAVSHERF